MILATLVLVAVSTPLSALLQEPAPQDSSLTSPLFGHIWACDEGRRILESLCEHLAPPRHRMQASVEVASITLRHGRRPDDHGSRQVTQRLRIFEVSRPSADQLAWRIDAEHSRAQAPDRPVDRVRVNDHFAIEDEQDGPGTALSGSEALRAQITHRAAFPAALAHYVGEAGQVLGSESTSEGGTNVLVGLDGGRVLVRTIPISYEYDGATVEVPGLVGIDWMTHSDLLGDVVESLTYTGAESPAPGVAAGWSITGPFGTGHRAEVTEVDLDSAVLPFAGGLFPDPASDPEAGRSLDDAIQARKIAPGVIELLATEHAARSLAVDLGRGWAVLEAPVSSSIGEAMIRALEEEKPGHPFLYAAASHHHPHYIGGLRPFAHRGATILCPADVVDYVEHVLQRPHTLRPDELARSKNTIKVVGVEAGQRWAPREAPERLIAVEAEGHSAHTEAFMLFFLPEAQIAFGGDLLWLADGESQRGPNPRTRGLAKILADAEDLGTSEFLTSWPAGGEAMGGTVWRDRASIAEIVAAR